MEIVFLLIVGIVYLLCNYTEQGIKEKNEAEKKRKYIENMKIQ